MTIRGDGFHEVFDDLKTEFLMGHFTPAETKGDFDLHFLAQEIDSVAELDPEVVRIDRRAELHFFYLVGVMVLLGFLFFFGLLVAELSVIDQATDRRGRIGGNLDEVHAVSARHVDGFGKGDDSELGAIDADDPDFAGADFAVDPYK